MKQSAGFLGGPFWAAKDAGAWAVAGEVDADHIKSNACENVWPPRSGRRIMIPEVDRAAWFTLEDARTRINTAQTPPLDEIERVLSPG